MNSPRSPTSVPSVTLCRLVTATAALAMSLGLATEANAEIMVCNDFQAMIHVAFAYPGGEGFTAAGWWDVKPNDCQRVDFEFQGASLYYAANSDSYRDGRETSRDHWGNKERLFVTKTKFNFDHAETDRRGAKSEMFSAYQIPAVHLGKPATITLHFVHGSTTINVSSK